MDVVIPSDGTTLAGSLVTRTGPRARDAVVLCHGFPTGPRGAAASASTLPELAERIAREVGCTALVFNCRGTGTSGGSFSVTGWARDVRAAVDFADELEHVAAVWLVGIAEGGTLAVCEAADDPRVRGVTTMAAPANLRAWGRDPGRFLEYAQRAGLVRDPEPAGLATAFARELQSVDAEACARRLPPRRVLVLHGSDDEAVPLDEARALAAAAGAELRVVQAGSHELRHDPRAIALLLGWLDRLS